MSATLSDSSGRNGRHLDGLDAGSDVWLPRQVLAEASWPGLQMRLCREDISRPSQWSIHSPATVVVVHLGGQMQSLRTWIEGFGARDRIARPGEIWLIPGQHRYQGQAEGGRIAYAELELADQVMMDGSGRDGGRLGELAPCLGRRDDFLAASVRQLRRLLHAGDDLSRMLADSLQWTLRLHLLRSYRTAGSVADPEPEPAETISAVVARRLRDYVESHLDRRITLADLAAIAGVGEHRLLAGFRQHFGTTPAQFVLDRRIERASRMLVQPHYGIADIALATGFSNHSHFSAAFRRRTGQTPQQFRRAR